jgi:hypothetical protein
VFPLDDRTDFWESRDCHVFEIPTFVPSSTAPVSGAFLFLGVDFLPERLRRGANQFAQRASVCENPVAFKRAETALYGIVAQRRSSRLRKRSIFTPG